MSFYHHVRSKNILFHTIPLVFYWMLFLSCPSSCGNKYVDYKLLMVYLFFFYHMVFFVVVVFLLVFVLSFSHVPEVVEWGSAHVPFKVTIKSQWIISLDPSTNTAFRESESESESVRLPKPIPSTAQPIYNSQQFCCCLLLLLMFFPAGVDLAKCDDWVAATLGLSTQQNIL